MTREDILERLEDVFKDVFDVRRIKISENTVSNDILGWDSLVHISLLAATEDEFDVNFQMEEAANFKNVGQMIDAIIRLSK